MQQVLVQLEKMDSNTDGQLDEHELTAGFGSASTARRILAKYDEDGDGMLSKAELSKMRDALSQQSPQKVTADSGSEDNSEDESAASRLSSVQQEALDLLRRMEALARESQEARGESPRGDSQSLEPRSSRSSRSPLSPRPPRSDRVRRRRVDDQSSPRSRPRPTRPTRQADVGDASEVKVSAQGGGEGGSGTSQHQRKRQKDVQRSKVSRAYGGLGRMVGPFSNHPSDEEATGAAGAAGADRKAPRSHRPMSAPPPSSLSEGRGIRNNRRSKLKAGKRAWRNECRWWRQQFQAVNDQLEYLHESPLMQSNMETPSPVPGSEAHKNAQPPQQVAQGTPGDGGDGTYGYGAYPGQGSEEEGDAGAGIFPILVARPQTSDTPTSAVSAASAPPGRSFSPQPPPYVGGGSGGDLDGGRLEHHHHLGKEISVGVEGVEGVDGVDGSGSGGGGGGGGSGGGGGGGGEGHSRRRRARHVRQPHVFPSSRNVEERQARGQIAYWKKELQKHQMMRMYTGQGAGQGDGAQDTIGEGIEGVEGGDRKTRRPRPPGSHSRLATHSSAPPKS